MVDADDQHHAPCTEAAQRIREPLGTTWPVLAEAIHLLRGHSEGQNAIWDMMARGTVVLMELGPDEIPRIRELMNKYADLPIDLADASLVRVAERERIRTIFTTDRRDFAVYRLHGRVHLKVIP